ncbi:hypothetical protein SADUNF_Sadunf09G0016500 [Salix dunnii]|uniref:Uncharacterized protein n=1 Tax=Salix dunnii TaxID=1413687 RepID=A0A835JVA6_9ROSI|nr:hypothetical protein SADUNF_Sadunf09G0016500 [Salix dunnii]
MPLYPKIVHCQCFERMHTTSVAVVAFSILSAVRSREQSMSSITIIDLLLVWISRALSSELSVTLVSSRSYTS